jgi:hypothetical protein
VLQDSEHTVQKFSLSLADRTKAICLRAWFPCAFLLAALSLFLSGAANDPRSHALRDLTVYCVVSGSVFFVLMLGGLARSDWLRATFLVGPESLVKTLPSGSTVEGTWHDLHRVAVGGGMRLTFKDGTAIHVSSMYPFYRELTRSVSKRSGGPEGNFSVALKCAEQQVREMWRAPSTMPVKRVYLYLQLPPAGLLLGSGVCFLARDGFLARRLLSAGIVLSPVLLVATFVGVRIWRRLSRRMVGHKNTRNSRHP